MVNSSRVVKLADFGMTRPMYENDYYRFSKRGLPHLSTVFQHIGSFISIHTFWP